MAESAARLQSGSREQRVGLERLTVTLEEVSLSEDVQAKWIIGEMVRDSSGRIGE
jgi:hypothetical protein